MKRNFFDISNIVFWLLAAIIGFLFLPYFKNGVYDNKKLEEWVKAFDTIQPQPQPQPDPIKEYAYKIWDWNDFNGKHHSIKFKYKVGSLASANNNRLSSSIFNPLGEHYKELYTHDTLILVDLIKQMKKYIKRNNLDYMNALEYVCSSIQDIPYTLILNEINGCPCEQPFGSFSANCKVQSDGRGCCDDVMPFGVYSPFEFVYKETGDCDTRALLAFTILKEMGFDVAVMVSYSKSHSVLGIANIIGGAGNSYGTNLFGKKYYLWELTSENWRFGYGVEGNDWKAALE
jgi:hypothetical protein